MAKLKLFALDNEDLDVVSAHLQDAVVRVADLHWLPAENRFVLMASRFDWSGGGGDRGRFQRHRTALHFERIMAVRRRAIRQDTPDAVLNLLAVRFVETDAPAGNIELIFSGGAEIRLEAECLEARLSDLGPVWSTASIPAHDGDIADPAPESPGTSVRKTP